MFLQHFPVVSVGAATTSNHSNYIITKPLSSSSFPKNSNHSLSRLRLATTPKCGVNVPRNEKNEIELGSAGFDAEVMPKHVAVIMDGNRRWAIERGLPVQDGHRAGGEAMKEFTKNCLKYGINVVTLFAVSTENFVRRPEAEAKAMMTNLIPELISSKNVDKLVKNDVRLSFIGNRKSLSESLQKTMSDAEERTKGNKRMHVLFTINYGGRYDVVQATKKIASEVKIGALQVVDIDDALFEQHLETNVINEYQNPDLLIRTSGELRTSNSMLWQLAYSEMFFINKCFPEFDEMDFVAAITAFQQRKRRFGGYAY